MGTPAIWIDAGPKVSIFENFMKYWHFRVWPGFMFTPSVLETLHTLKPPLSSTEQPAEPRPAQNEDRPGEPAQQPSLERSDERLLHSGDARYAGHDHASTERAGGGGADQSADRCCAEW